jgi:hypothetical protein
LPFPLTLPEGTLSPYPNPSPTFASSSATSSIDGCQKSSLSISTLVIRLGTRIDPDEVMVDADAELDRPVVGSGEREGGMECNESEVGMYSVGGEWVYAMDDPRRWVEEAGIGRRIAGVGACEEETNGCEGVSGVGGSEKAR